MRSVCALVAWLTDPRARCFCIRLLADGVAEGAVAVSGVEMFVGQAAEQFRLFTGVEPPVDLMRKTVVDALN